MWFALIDLLRVKRRFSVHYRIVFATFLCMRVARSTVSLFIAAIVRCFCATLVFSGNKEQPFKEYGSLHSICGCYYFEKTVSVDDTCSCRLLRSMTPPDVNVLAILLSAAVIAIVTVYVLPLRSTSPYMQSHGHMYYVRVLFLLMYGVVSLHEPF